MKADDADHHHNSAPEMIERVRDWLAGLPFRDRSHLIPGADWLIERYVRFEIEAPSVCKELFLTFGKLKLDEFCTITTDWLNQQQAILAAAQALLNPKAPYCMVVE